MSDLDVRSLEANFAVWKRERAADLSDSKAFERYAVEQIVKDFDLSDDELDSGDLGGRDDGGVDAVYLFMNTLLIAAETDPPIPVGTVELHLIQAKYEKGFSEIAVEKLEAFARDLLAYDKPVDGFTYLNSKARDAIRNFRDKYDAVMGGVHTLTVKFHYACKAISRPGPNDKVSLRARNLTTYVRSQLTAANVEFIPWDSCALLEKARSAPLSEVVLPITKHFSADDGSTVCLVRLKDFAEKMLTDESGKIQTRFLEPNVRDYNGKTNPVNEQIRSTLEDSAPKEEFWWLNNGITILASGCPLNGNKLKISNPEIVNGLQTSHEIFGWYGARKGTDDSRNVLLRILLPSDERSKTKIIKATNSQTKVSDLSLMSTDRVQEDIEDKLRLYGLFYDRKKGEYRRLKKPIKKIVSILSLAQAVIAVYLQQPNEARGRPQQFVGKNPKKVFDISVDRDVYATCVLLDRQVEAYLETINSPYDYRRDIRYYVDMVVACELTKSLHPTGHQLAGIVGVCVKPINNQILAEAASLALNSYSKLGGSDVVAKGTDLRDELLTHVDSKGSTS